MNRRQPGAQRVIDNDRQLCGDKEELKEHGYRWLRKVVQSSPDPVFRWALLDPQGQQISKEQALRDIGIAANPEPDDGADPIH